MQEASEAASLGASVDSSMQVRATIEPIRHRLPGERRGVVHHFSVGGHEGYLLVGLYENGQPGELFIRMAKAGSTVGGLMASFGIAVSLALQYGVPLSALCNKFSHMRFEPSGWSGVQKIGYAKSIMDYISRWLELRFLPPKSPLPTGAGVQAPAPAPAHPTESECRTLNRARPLAVRCHHEQQRLMLPLRELWVDERLLVNADQ